MEIPDFALRAVLRHEPQAIEGAVALLTDDTKRARICQATEAAVRAGVALGMTAPQAKARRGDIAFRVRSEILEEAAQEILLECAYASAAYIESTAPGVCTMDLRGLALAAEDSDGLEKWGAGLVERLDRFFLPARIGVADAPGLAGQAARRAQPFLHVRDEKAFWKKAALEDLEDLAPGENLLGILRQWGLRTAGQFLELGKDRIGERLGLEGIQFFDRISAGAKRPLKLTAPRQIYEEFHEFAEPVEMLEPLLFILRRFLDQLARRLEQAFLSVQELKLSLELESGEIHERTLEIPAPTREVEALFRILHNYLENVRTRAPVQGLRLRATPCPTETRQSQLFETAVRDPHHFYEMVGRLGALLGPDRVGVPVVQPTHRPDDLRMTPVTTGPTVPGKPEGSASSAPARGLMLRRFRPPLPAQVRLHGTTPVFVRCSRVSAAVLQSAGPWRTSGHWWETENTWNREEWDVQTRDGGLYRLYRDASGWFVEGAYD